MFDRLQSSRFNAEPGRFAEGFDAITVAGPGGFSGNEAFAAIVCYTGLNSPTQADGDGGPLFGLNADDRGVFGPNGKPSLSSTDAGAQITRTNQSWATGLGTAATVTYAFRDTVTTMPSDTTGFTQFNSVQIAAGIQAFTAWSDVANITFQRVQDAGSEYSNNATILLANYSSGQDGAAAFAYLPGGMPGASGFGQVQGDVWINSSLSYNSLPQQLGYGQLTMLHEIGHAIGLSHPAAYNAGSGGTITYSGSAIYYEDSLQYSVMSYFDEQETGAAYFGPSGGGFGTGRYASAPLLDDISASQRLYGANMTTRTGDTVYGFNSNTGRLWFQATTEVSLLIFSAWDAGGTDTFDFSGYSTNGQVIDLRQGSFSSIGGLTGNVSIALGAVIENAIGGTGSDTFRGNSANNRFTPQTGTDVVDGGLGSDTVVFSGALAAYTVTWNGQTGTVVGNGQNVTVTNVEFLQFTDQTIAAAPTGGLVVGGDITNETITGTALADVIGGLGGTDTINGLAGHDVLNGGSGDDTLNGGDDNDTLIGGLGNDALNGATGIDTIDYSGAGAAVTVSLTGGTSSGGAGFDTISGVENVTGTVYADTITGDSNANVLIGGGGIDTLNGGGGADSLQAGAPGEGGGAPDIIKGSDSANGSIGNAISLAGAFDLRSDSAVANSTTIPHATVLATTHGGVEYYSITVAAGESVTFDIDNASFDSTLRILTAGSVELAANDDNNADGGPSTDSSITHVFSEAGTYYVQVAQWVSGSGSFVSGPPTAGQTYRLNVSSAGQTPVPIAMIGSTLNGEAGTDTLVGGSGADSLNGGTEDDLLTGAGGNDTINGGDGTDTAVFSGNRSAYTVSVSGGVTTVTGPDGTDTVSNVERLQFADQITDAAGAPLGGAINGTGESEALNGDGGANVINGLGGDDTINAGGGNDTIDGGEGTDTAVFSGARAGYTVSTVGATTTVTGPDGTDTLTNVERLQFSDLTLIVGAGGGQYFGGTAGDDTINGTAFNDQINGSTGQDTINGLAGNDVIHGNDGNDIINAGTGVDQVFGDGGTDTFLITAVTSGQPDSTFDGGTGTDTFDASGVATALTFDGSVTSGQFTVGDNTVTGVEVVRGGSAGDVLNFQAFTTAMDLHGGDGADTVQGGTAADRLYGGLGIDQLTGAAGDQLYGEDGDDQLTVIGSATATGVIASGGAGIDTVTLSGSASTLDLATGVGTVGSTNVTASAVENVRLTGAGTSARTLLGSSAANRLEVLAGGTGFSVVFDGRGGDDILIGGALDDTLTGGAGIDQLFGGDGADSLNGDAGDQLYGENGNDTLVFTGSTAVAGSVIAGGSGTDTARLVGTSTSVDLAAGNGTVGSTAVALSGLENVIVEGTGAGVRTVLGSGDANVFTVGTLDTGSVSFDGRGGNDSLTGSAQGDTLRGGDNDDVVAGLAGADSLFGDAGDDILRGGAGNDALDGGAGTADIADYRLAAAGVTVNLLTGSAANDGDGGTDQLTGIEVVYGSIFNDSLTGDAGNNTFRGGAGVDAIHGGLGVDTVDYSAAAAGMRAQLNTNASSNDGDGGTDSFSGIENLTGSAFNDLLIGDGVGNVLRGGLGADTLLGLGGNDTLWGGTGVGNTLQGGLGDDTYVLEALDSIVEAAGEGTDTVDARINTYTLATHVENLVFGGTGNFNGTGNAANNVITGGTGTDVLRGRGGVDVLNGGGGIDTADYTLAAAGVVARIDLQRATNDGDGATDTYTSIENLIGSNFNDTLIGDNNANVLMGGIGQDVLLGFGGNDILMGGSGGINNQLQGGTGDDYYILEAFDTCVEFAGEGIDTVEAKVGSYTLGNNLENLLYTGPGKFVGTGNALDNVLTGGNQDDILRGRGGNDSIYGGAGVDEVQLRGLAANYTITAEGAGYRIVDSVAGRDGSTYVESIERLRFSNNATQVLTYGAPGALEPADKTANGETTGGPLVSPLLDDVFGTGPEVMPLADDDFLPLIKVEGPEVLPGVFGPGTLDDDLMLIRPEVMGFKALLQMDGLTNPLVLEGPDGPRLLHDRTGDYDDFGWGLGINPWG